MFTGLSAGLGALLKEGWFGSDYLILFTAEEAASAMQRYHFADALPGHTVLGLRGWDDFIVSDTNGRTYTVPTVPLDIQLRHEFELPANPPLQNDPRYEGKIKWYVKPLIFGGDPRAGDNLT